MGLPFMFPQAGTNLYQQLLQQYQQQNMAGQNQVTVFQNVPSEEVARKWDLAPGVTGNFINTNEKYIYIKTAGASMLEPYKFTKIRLEEETEEVPQQQQMPNLQAPQVQESQIPQMNMEDYVKKEEFSLLENKVNAMQEICNEFSEVAKELKG